MRSLQVSDKEFCLPGEAGERADKSGLSDLSSYVLAVLKEYSVSLELKKIE
jgi:hypothetical protein